ncbi:MAG: hypothetical protein PHY26_02710 [Bacilli bacterium]|jgi:hypothetical protein|nr:hypothetical protein [Bacilli bacterium]
MAKKKLKKKPKSDEIEAIEQHDNMFKLLGIVIVIFLVFYIITIYVTDQKKEIENNPIVEIQYDEILAGKTFKMPPSEYYVLFFDREDPNASVYSYLRETYLEKTEAIPIYVVDLKRGFNASYVADNSNKKVNRSADLKINGPTLIKIKQGKNVLYKEGLEEIKETLK